MPYTMQDAEILKKLLGVEEIPPQIDSIYDQWQRRHHNVTNGSLDLASLETICFWAQQTGLLNQTLADVNEHRANERPKHVGQVEIASLRVGTLLLVKQPGNRKPQRARFQAPLGGQKVSLRYIESDAKAPVFDEKGVLAEEAVPEMLSKNVEEVDRKKIAVLAEL